MGQQQLLLLVMSVVVVGVAMIVGMAMGRDALRRGAVDHLVDRNLAIANEAVLWRQKSMPFSGGGGTYSGLATNGMATLVLSETTPSGYFQITRATTDELEITGISLRFPDIGARTLVRNQEIVSTDIAYDGSITLDEVLAGE